MLKKYKWLLLFQIVLAALSGYLTSKISLMGKIGVGTFYKSYAFLKSPWQAALVFLSVQIIFIILLWLNDKRASLRSSRLVILALMALSIVGLYFTYQDFRTNLAHRWLGERFHLGIYLYFVGFLVSSLVLLLKPNRPLKKKVVRRK